MSINLSFYISSAPCLGERLPSGAILVNLFVDRGLVDDSIRFGTVLDNSSRNQSIQSMMPSLGPRRSTALLRKNGLPLLRCCFGKWLTCGQEPRTQSNIDIGKSPTKLRATVSSGKADFAFASAGAIIASTTRGVFRLLLR